MPMGVSGRPHVFQVLRRAAHHPLESPFSAYNLLCNLDGFVNVIPVICSAKMVEQLCNEVILFSKLEPFLRIRWLRGRRRYQLTIVT